MRKELASYKRKGSWKCVSILLQDTTALRIICGSTAWNGSEHTRKRNHVEHAFIFELSTCT